MGPMNPNWKGGKIGKICGVCYSNFSVYPYRKNTAKCCSRECLNKSPEMAAKNRILKVGSKNPAWKGGKIKDVYGYVLVRVNSLSEREQELARVMNTNRGYIKEHRIIMASKLGGPLEENEEVHHRNGMKDDNRIENLEIVIKKAHWDLGNQPINCPFCGKEFKVRADES